MLHDKKEHYKKRKYENLPQGRETVQELTNRRLYKLGLLFSQCEHDVKVIGDPEKPVFIIDHKIILSAFVRNFKLIFTDRPNGDRVDSMSITEKNRMSCEELDDFLKNYEHRECYRIRIKNTPLYLCGYNFKDKLKRTKENRYPVFSEITEKYYFSRRKAQEVVDIHPRFNLEII